MRDARDMKIMSGQVQCDAHLSPLEADLRALIKRRFIPHGSCVNAIFPCRPSAHRLHMYGFNEERPTTATDRGRDCRKVRVSDLASQCSSLRASE